MTTPRNVAIEAVIEEARRRGLSVYGDVEVDASGAWVRGGIIIDFGGVPRGDLRALERVYRRAMRRAGGDPVARPLGTYQASSETIEAIVELERRAVAS